MLERDVWWSSVEADYLVADAALCDFKGSTEDAQEPVYKENAASLSEGMRSRLNMHGETITHCCCFSSSSRQATLSWTYLHQG